MSIRIKGLWPVAQGLHGSGAIVLGWDVYERGVPFWVKPLHRLFKSISNLKHAIYYRWHPGYRYNVVKTELPPGFYEHDTRMLYACMAVLNEFIREEFLGNARVDAWLRKVEETNDFALHPEDSIHAMESYMNEACLIYLWWRIERPRNQKRRADLCHRLSWTDKEEILLYAEFRNLEEKIDRDEQEYLKRLVEIRPYLWV